MTSQLSRTASRAFTVRMLLASAVLTLAASIAHAAPSEVQTFTVKSGDLNLATPEGNRELYRRIVVAAEKVCSTPPVTGTRLPVNSRACMKKAIADAVKAMKNPQLAELAEAERAMGARS